METYRQLYPTRLQFELRERSPWLWWLSGEAVAYIVKDPSAGWGEGLLSGSLVGDRPSVGTVRRGWFPSKHTTCKRQLPDTRPHQAIVTVSSSSLHLSPDPVFPTSSDPPRLVVPRYARLNVPLLFLSLLLSACYFTNVRSYGRTVMYRRLSFPSLLQTKLARVEKEKEKEEREGRRERERETSSRLPPSLPPFSILVPRGGYVYTLVLRLLIGWSRPCSTFVPLDRFVLV